MDNPICSLETCTSMAMAHAVGLSERNITEQVMLCKDHAKSLTDNYHQLRRSAGGGQSAGSMQRILFDIEGLYSEKPVSDGKEVAIIYLKQVGGHLRIPIQTGLYELAALHRALQKRRPFRPPPHHAMAAVVAALHGRLDYVTLDKFLSAEKAIQATLHIHHDDREVVVDVRPSDAIILAVLCNSQIFAEPDLIVDFEGEK